MNERIQTKTTDGIALWTLNRPERRNALDRATVQALYDLALRAAKDPALRAVVITGAGEHAFCAGADLKERIGLASIEVAALLDAYRKAFDAIDSLPIPVVAALNGSALGGGLELALAADFRVAASSAQLGLPETGLGIIPGAGGTQRLPRLIGVARAKEMIVFAQRISAAEALDIGLIHRVAKPTQTAEACAMEFLEPLANVAPLAVSAALEAIDRGLSYDLSQGLTVERRYYEQTIHTEDRQEALQAFLAKRKPQFKGR